MTAIDLFTLTLATALVIVVSGVFYLVETLLRKEGAAGRLWAIAFLSGILSVLCYLVWSVDASALLALPVGTVGILAPAGFLGPGRGPDTGRSLRWAGVARLAVV